MAVTRLGDIGESISAIPFDDAYADIIVIERAAMAVASTRRIATRHSDDTTALWVVRELGYNSLGEMIYIKRLSESTSAPTWAQTYL